LALKGLHNWAHLDSNQGHRDYESLSAKSQVLQPQGLKSKGVVSLQVSLQEESKNDVKTAEKLPPELARVIKAWPDLPKHIKQSITALVKSCTK
jgi:hypothetical protein